MLLLVEPNVWTFDVWGVDEKRHLRCPSGADHSDVELHCGAQCYGSQGLFLRKRLNGDWSNITMANDAVVSLQLRALAPSIRFLIGRQPWVTRRWRDWLAILTQSLLDIISADSTSQSFNFRHSHHILSFDPSARQQCCTEVSEIQVINDAPNVWGLSWPTNAYWHEQRITPDNLLYSELRFNWQYNWQYNLRNAPFIGIQPDKS